MSRLVANRPQGHLEQLLGHERFEHMAHDVTEPFVVEGDIDRLLHLASPAYPLDHLRWSIETLRVGAIGTVQALELARATRATSFLASTSESYSDPLVHSGGLGIT